MSAQKYVDLEANEITTPRDGDKSIVIIWGSVSPNKSRLKGCTSGPVEILKKTILKRRLAPVIITTEFRTSKLNIHGEVLQHARDRREDRGTRLKCRHGADQACSKDGPGCNMFCVKRGCHQVRTTIYWCDAHKERHSKGGGRRKGCNHLGGVHEHVKGARGCRFFCRFAGCNQPRASKYFCRDHNMFVRRDRWAPKRCKLPKDGPHGVDVRGCRCACAVKTGEGTKCNKPRALRHLCQDHQHHARHHFLLYATSSKHGHRLWHRDVVGALNIGVLFFALLFGLDLSLWSRSIQDVKKLPPGFKVKGWAEIFRDGKRLLPFSIPECGRRRAQQRAPSAALAAPPLPAAPVAPAAAPVAEIPAGLGLLDDDGDVVM